MKKLFVLLAFVLGTFWFTVFWRWEVCVSGDIESACICRAKGGNRNKPINQETYNSCIAEEKAKRTQKTPEVKQAELEEKVKNLEEKTETVVEKVETVVEKVETVVEKVETVVEKVETVVEKVEKVVEKKMTQEEAQAYAELKEKSAVIDGLFEAIKTKDKATQEQIKSVAEAFKKSSDQYTKNIGFYLGYLMR